MFRLLDRKETGYCLSPTAEEVVTTLVAQEYGSYRDLPVNLYQINWKYRDELRPRFGLLRGREFLMKDAYSFDLDLDGLRTSYQPMYDAYHRVFERCGLTFRPVEARVGRDGRRREPRVHGGRGGRRGRLRLVPDCDYAANVEAARRAGAPTPNAGARRPRRRWRRCTRPTCPASRASPKFLGVEPSTLLKSHRVRRRRRARARARARRPRGQRVRARGRARARSRCGSTPTTTSPRIPSSPKGYIGPHYAGATVVVADPAVRGADRRGSPAPTSRPPRAQRGARPRLRRRRLGRPRHRSSPATPARVAGSRCRSTAASRSVTCSSSARSTREALDAHYTDENGEQHPMVMGCYGIGVSRDRRGGRRGVPRRARARVAGGARAVRRAPHRGARAGRAGGRRGRGGRSRLRRAARAWGSTCSTTTAT